MKKLLLILAVLISLSATAQLSVNLADSTKNGVQYSFVWNGKILFSPADSIATIWGTTIVVVESSRDTILSQPSQATIKLSAIQTQFNTLYNSTTVRNKFSKEALRRLNKTIFRY